MGLSFVVSIVKKVVSSVVFCVGGGLSSEKLVRSEVSSFQRLIELVGNCNQKSQPKKDVRLCPAVSGLSVVRHVRTNLVLEGKDQ